tara:strand:- start:475 stop:735 length:261 start_codon:yes stop_codon:yes gene_type:complete
MSEKLKELHDVLATELLKRVKDPDAKSADLNVARQFLKDNNIDAVPVDDSPLKKLMEELPFTEGRNGKGEFGTEDKPYEEKTVIKN